MTNTEKERQKAITTAGNPAKPTGEAGQQMLARMNESHAALTAWACLISSGTATKRSWISAAAGEPTSIV
ncbi:hypothetical protein [Megasphaera elsdenii]|uniref:hypothetical protein n=1 Tax=Megasphaera elsdenii TaxID=907 RepID=UPI00242D07E9|nr:hypothetical protein [Megasphaera elsdenii]